MFAEIDSVSKPFPTNEVILGGYGMGNGGLKKRSESGRIIGLEMREVQLS